MRNLEVERALGSAERVLMRNMHLLRCILIGKNLYFYDNALINNPIKLRISDDKYLKLLGERIVSLRKTNQITQLELAEKIKTTNTHIRRIERGETNVTISTLRRIAKELGVSIAELVDIK
jgi:DNA-binding XRE family transcriptional regulator